MIPNLEERKYRLEREEGGGGVDFSFREKGKLREFISVRIFLE